MILARPYQAADQPRIEELYQANGKLGPSGPDGLLASAVIEVDGEIQIAGFVRRTAEAYLVLDPQAKVRKRDRVGQILILHKELFPLAGRAGCTELHCWIPPEIEGSYGKMLLHLGWEKHSFPGYRLEVK